MLSVLVPTIRPQNLPRLYESIEKSYSGEWELILCGPYYPPKEIQEKKNVIFIQSWRSPAAAQQTALLFATGKLLTWGADDGIFLPKMLDEAITYYSSKKDINTILSCMYKEGGGENMQSTNYYKITSAPAMRALYIKPESIVINVGILSTTLVKVLGGWDSQLESASIAHQDFAVRAANFGCNIELFPFQIFECSHLKEELGDHGPVHRSHIKNEKVFREIYSKPESVYRFKIDLYNCFHTDSVWKERFNG